MILTIPPHMTTHCLVSLRTALSIERDRCRALSDVSERSEMLGRISPYLTACERELTTRGERIVRARTVAADA